MHGPSAAAHSALASSCTLTSRLHLYYSSSTAAAASCLCCPAGVASLYTLTSCLHPTYCCGCFLPPAVLQAWEDLKSGSGYSSEAGMQLADMSNYLITKGLGHLPKPMWWLNGLLAEVPEGGHNSVDSAVGFAIMTVSLSGCVCVERGAG